MTKMEGLDTFLCLLHKDVQYFVDVNNRNADKNNAKVRTVGKDEIVIEFDTDDKLLVGKLVLHVLQKLRNNNINHFMFSHEGRSPHIIIPAIHGLDKVSANLRRQYKRKFIEYICSYNDELFPAIDFSFTHENQLIALEGKPHFKDKYNGNIKECIYYSITNNVNRNYFNIINPEIMKRAIQSNEFYSKLNSERPLDNTNYNWFLNWLLNTELKQGNRDTLIYKNLAILLVNNNLDVEPYTSAIGSYDYSINGELRGWMKWAMQEQRYFNVREIEQYCEGQDIDISEVIEQWQNKD